MRLATVGNLRVAAAAQDSFGKALQLGYRTGTITGMLTDGLGLLGGSIIFLIYGEQAYEALLGFGFGGTLLALFMRVGGGIYTKAADVGADLVGKVEKDIPEDDPRNAATIADNVGDNVGDCAGMAADIFESYEVTIVAAMILGIASFGHKGVIFPLLVRAIGVIASIISTYSVRCGDKGTAGEAMKSVNRGFVIGSILSVVGFMLLGFWFICGSTTGYLARTIRKPAAGLCRATRRSNVTSELAALGHARRQTGLDMRAAWACLIGIILAVALNKCTEYYTGTEYSPVKSLAKSCETGHATNIIQGFAVGYESSVAAVLIIAAAILASALVFTGTSPTFIAFGVAMAGIGMLTLTGNTISMDVFGPVADNANGIGEMGYDKATRWAKPSTRKPAQTLADLDAVGNTTKAITKGIAIGSAVIAAVSLFNSFIVSVGTGGKGENEQISANVYNARRRPADALRSAAVHRHADRRRGAVLVQLDDDSGGRPGRVFDRQGMPHSIPRQRDLGRHQEARLRPRRRYLHRRGSERTGRAGACWRCSCRCWSASAWATIALAGFLGGMIVTGQLLAVFMANAGGAWDNAKKTVEDEPRNMENNTGKGSEKHKAAVTGDTVGDPLKDTAGPAINPLIKVMNMVSLLIIGLILPYDGRLIDKLAGLGLKLPGIEKPLPLDGLFWGAIIVCAIGLIWAIWQSKRENPEMNQTG